MLTTPPTSSQNLVSAIACRNGDRLRPGINGPGVVVLLAAAATFRGAGLSEVISTSRNAMRRARSLCLSGTLNYLPKGGQVGKTEAMSGSVLKIKPMIIVQDGEMHPQGWARTFSTALAKMKETVRGYVPSDPWR